MVWGAISRFSEFARIHNYLFGPFGPCPYGHWTGQARPAGPGPGPKLGQNWSKLVKNGQYWSKLVKNWSISVKIGKENLSILQDIFAFMLHTTYMQGSLRGPSKECEA